jgi:hypothetical protein
VDYITDLGAIQCNTITDNVTFGGISMDNFQFGSCYEEIDLFYPERYIVLRRLITVSGLLDLASVIKQSSRPGL